MNCGLVIETELVHGITPSEYNEWWSAGVSNPVVEGVKAPPGTPPRPMRKPLRMLPQGLFVVRHNY